MKPFRERNPVVIGAVGIAVIAVLLIGAFNIDAIPLLVRGSSYSLALSEAGGLKEGDDVRVAGVKVGKITAISLDGDHVRVDVRVDGDTRLGDRTRASVRIKTLLGQKFVMLEPAGSGRMRPGSTIPLDRTTPAYDVVDAFSDLTTTTEDIDTEQLAKALDTVASTFHGTPDEVKAAVDGLSRLSRTVASRDAKLRELLAHANGVTKVLADRNAEFTKLLDDGDLLLQEVRRRREAVHTLLVSTAKLADELSGLVADNRAQLRPSLERLRSVVQLLQKHQDDLDRSVALLAPFVRVFANTLGNGPWFDTYIQNLVPVPGAPKLPDVTVPGLPALPGAASGGAR